ncbi:MAG TPA: enoyl-ACP reductase [Gammaproteobacteria bacterium]|nr:enoyl-ACP reductase [Gammaproteobacteria bacterium]
MLLKNKCAIITGIASNRSIAYAIAKTMQQHGANIILTYPNENMKTRIIKLFPDISPDMLLPCDVSSDEQLMNLSSLIPKTIQTIDIIIHSIAFAPQEQLSGKLSENINRAGFLSTQEVSVYSFPALIQSLRQFLKPQSCALTLSYIGAKRAVPNYNVMGIAKAGLEASVRYLAYELGPEGIRVNCISAGPIKTLAAAGIKGFRNMLKYDHDTSPLPGNTETQEVADTSVFLCSNMAAGITGQTLYVDHGFHITAFSGAMNE